MAAVQNTVAILIPIEQPALASELGPGTEIDHFRIVRLIGRGGMGEVFLARDTQLGRKVALKLITSVGPQSPHAVARFLHEARTTAMFSHPNIVTLYAAGEHAGRPYVALEYLEGESLRERLDAERLAPAAALRVMHSVALAAAEAHAHGVLHRDLKPENVLLPRDGRVRVLDFGLAKPTDDGATSPADALLSTAHLQPERVTHGIAGSPAYMAPEQWRGAPSTPATDVWALGVMLYELLAGRRPQEATQLFGLCINVTSSEPTPELPLDVPVSDAVRALVDRCLRKIPAERPLTSEVVETLEAAMHPSRAVASSASPFRGLLPFVERNASLYFGRDDEIAAFVERLRDQPALAVVGASGAGKSSFVQAGVLPRLREEGRWHSFVMRPGRDPFGTLATRLLGASTTLQVGEAAKSTTSGARTTDVGADAEKLARELRASPAALVVHLQRIAERDGSRILLVIDQLEELYGLVEDEAIRAAFLSAVCAAADDAESPVRVVFTLREDFVTRIAGLPETRGVLGHFVVLRQPDERGLRQMIERPIERAGYRFGDDTLVADMVESVRGEPASLPLLQFACTKLWEARDEGQKLLTRAAYEAFGGVVGALAHHADALLGTMTDEQQKLARSLLLRLVSAEGTRRVQTRSEVFDGLSSNATAVLDKLVEARLLTVRRRMGGDDAVELAHESLANTWTRLRRWRDEARDELVLSEELESAARLWDKRGQPADEVWKGEALADAVRRLAPVLASLPELSRRFLAAGQGRAARDKRRKRIVVSVVFALMALAAIGAVAVAFTISGKEREVRQQRNEAERGRAEALLESAAGSLREGDPATARAKLRSALTIRDDVRARALWWKLRRDPLVWKKRAEWGMGSLAWSREGDQLLTMNSGRLERLDLSTLAVTTALMTPAGYMFGLSSDGSRAAVVGVGNGDVTVFDLANRTVVKVLPAATVTDRLTAPAFSPDGRRLAFAARRLADQGSAPPLKVVDLATGRTVLNLSGSTGQLTAAYAPSGDLMATQGDDEMVSVWDAATGVLVRTIDGLRPMGVEFSSDGRSLLAVAKDSSVRFYDPRTGAIRFAYPPCTAPVVAMALHPDGRTVAIAVEGGAVRVLSDAVHGTRDVVLSGPVPTGLAFSPDGRYLAANAQDDKSSRVWDLRVAGDTTQRGPESAVRSIAATPAGDRVLTGGEAGEVWLWNAADGSPIRRLGSHTGMVVATAIAPSGEWAVTGGADGALRTWDLRRALPSGVTELGSHVNAVAISPDGSAIVVATTDGTVRSLNARNGMTLWAVPSAGVTPGATTTMALAYTADAREVATARTDAVVSFRDSQTGRETEAWPVGAVPMSLAVSPDGTRFAAAPNADRVRVWSRRGGAARDFATSSGRVFGLLFAGNDTLLSTEDFGVSVLDLAANRPPLVMRNVQTMWQAVISGQNVVSDVGAAIGSWNLRSGRPTWRLGMTLPDPPVLFDGSAWRSLDDGSRVELPASRWRTAVEERSRIGRASRDGDTLCFLTLDGYVELWDRRADEQILRAPAPSSVNAFPLHDACIVGHYVEGMGDRPVLYHRSGVTTTLPSVHYSASDSEIFIGLEDHLEVLDARGTTLARYPAHSGLAAAVRTTEVLAVAYEGGLVEVTSMGGQAESAPRVMTSVSDTSLIGLVKGPGETLIGSYRNGIVVAWDIPTGAAIAQTKAVGAVISLYVNGNRVYAVTDVGRSTVLDLTGFAAPYCDVMREVWNAIPVEWEHGAAVPRATPRDHPCSAP